MIKNVNIIEKLCFKIFNVLLCIILISFGIFSCHKASRFRSSNSTNLCSLNSINITPANPSINSGGTQQFTATGTLGGMNVDVTSFVTWNSSNTAIVTISSSGGLATGLIPGLSEITASLPNSCPSALTSNSVTLTVVPRFAYIANLYAQVTVCNVNGTTGQLSGCVDSGFDSFSAPWDIDIQIFGGQTFAYVTNINGTVVFQCTINSSTGLFTECIDATRGSFSFTNNTSGIAFNTALDGNIYAYIVNYNGSSDTFPVTMCIVDPTTGAFSSCGDSGAGSIFSRAAAIAFNQSEGQTYVYVTEGDGGSSDIAQCAVNSTGSFVLNTCQTLTTGFRGSEGIAFLTVGSQNYAYVAQWDNSTPLISRCTVGSNGFFESSNCVDSSLSVAFNEPVSTKFITINGEIFAFVVDGRGNEVWQCTVNSTTADLTNCVHSGASLISFPFSIAFF